MIIHSTLACEQQLTESVNYDLYGNPLLVLPRWIMPEMLAHFQPNQQNSALKYHLYMTYHFFFHLRRTTYLVNCKWKVNSMSHTTLAERVVEFSFPRNSRAELSIVYKSYKSHHGKLKGEEKLNITKHKLLAIKCSSNTKRRAEEHTNLIIWWDLELLSFKEVSPILLWAATVQCIKKLIISTSVQHHPVNRVLLKMLYLHKLQGVLSNGSSPSAVPLWLFPQWFLSDENNLLEQPYTW